MQHTMFKYKIRCVSVKTIVLFMLIVFWTGAMAQKTSERACDLGGKIGVVSASMRGGRIKSGPRIVFEGGIWCRIKLSKRWSGQAEILYIEKGTDYKIKQNAGTGGYAVSLMYIEFPVLFQYRIKNIVLEGGPGAGVLFFQKEIVVGAPIPDQTKAYPFHKAELSFNLGCGYSLNEKWFLGLRFTHSVLPVRKQLPGIHKQVYNRVVAIVIARKFSCKKTKARETPSVG